MGEGVPEGALAAVFEHCPDALLVLDGHGRVMALNRAAQALFDLRPEEVLGRTVHELEAWMRERGGSKGPRVEVAVAPIPGAGPDAPALVVSARRVGGQERLASSLADMAQLADTRTQSFLRQVCHELRTPMQAIDGFCQLMEGQEGLSASVRGILAQIRLPLTHLEALMARLAVSTPASGDDFPLETAAMPLAPVVNQCLRIIEGIAHPRGVQVHALPMPPLVVRADETRVRQVLLNLLANAVQYHRPGGRVWVEVEAQETCAQVSVWDDGPGIAPEDQARVFTPYKRLGDGETGLGLALSRAMVEAMGGEMGLESPHADGQGCRFWFTLPLV